MAVSIDWGSFWLAIQKIDCSWVMDICLFLDWGPRVQVVVPRMIEILHDPLDTIYIYTYMGVCRYVYIYTHSLSIYMYIYTILP